MAWPAAPLSMLETLVTSASKEHKVSMARVSDTALAPFETPSEYLAAIIFEPLASYDSTARSAEGKNTTTVQLTQEGGNFITRENWRRAGFDGVAPSKIPLPTEQLCIGYLLDPRSPFRNRKTSEDEYLPNLSGEARAEFDKVHQDRLKKIFAGESVTAQVNPYSHENDVTAHIDLVFTFKWKDKDGETRQSQASLIFTPRNAEVNMPVAVATSDQVPEVFRGQDKCSIYAHSKVFSMTGIYTAAKVWSRNLTSEGDFGPHTDLVRSLSSYAVHGARFFIVTGSGEGVRDDIERYHTDAKEDIAQNPYERYWTPEARASCYLPKHIDNDNARPQPSTARIAFEDMDEFMAREMLALRRDRDHEESRTKRTYAKLPARFVAVPGKGNETALLVLIKENPRDPCEFQDDEVLIRVHALNPQKLAHLDWKGRVINALPNLPIRDQIILARRPPSEPGKAFGQDISVLGKLPRWEDMDEAAVKLLDAQKPRLVDISIVADESAYRRQCDTLRTAFDLVRHEKKRRGSSMTADLLTCNRLDRLPVLDLLADFTDEQRVELTRDLSLYQQKALHLFRKMPGGFGIIMGCAGAGKSYMLVTILTHYLRHIMRTTQSPHPGLAALVLTPINTNADGLTNSFNQAFKKAGIEDAIVIRKFPDLTDRDLFKDGTGLNFGARGDVYPKAFSSEKANEMSRLLFAELAQRQERQSCKDKRVKEETQPFSVASWMIRILDQKVDDLAACRAASAVGSTLIRAISSAVNGDWSTETRVEHGYDDLDMMFKDAISRLLGAADIVIATCSEGMDVTITGMKPRIFALDEAAVAQSVDGYGWVFFPDCKYRILLGDVYQNRPQIQSPASVNPFAAQMKLSYIARLVLAGFPYVTQYEQHRFVEQIANVLGRTFYPAPLRTAASSTAERAEGKAKFIDFMAEIGSIYDPDTCAPILIADVGEGFRESLSASKSKFNRKTAAVTWEIVKELKTKGGYSPSEIGIITPYTAQRAIHERIALLKRSQKEPADYLIDTAQRAQSLSRDILIVDIPNSKSIGFLAEDTRVNTALSRCRYGMIIVCVEKVFTWRRYERSGIEKFIHSALAHGGRLRVPTSAETDMVLEKTPRV